MEVVFLDVSQSTCQVILLGGRRAIVIDCGTKNDSLLLQFLKRAGVENIEALIISHSHSDHIGGAVSVLNEYQGRITKIGFVQDHLFLDSAFWARISTLLKEKKLSSNHLVRLEYDQKPKIVWSDSAKDFKLLTYSPSAAENLLSQAEKTPNPTSAVLVLKHNKERILFSADSDVSQWKEVHSRVGRKLTCKVLSVPHHAGKVHTRFDDLNWLFKEAIGADIAIVSVGTSNTHGHPREDIVRALRGSDTHVMCTQFTRKCHSGNRNLEFLRPGVLKPQSLLGRSSATQDLTASNNSRNVACAGSVKVSIGKSGIVVDRLNDHKKAVDDLVMNKKICPLCRLDS